MTSVLALTREISPAIERCELTHLERVPIDLARARAEHDEYENALRALGCRVYRLPTSPEMPDSVFIEDTAIVLDEMAVITRPGAPSRRVETAAVAEVVRMHRPVAAVLAPGTLDGGDVLRAGRRLFVGRGHRSNDDGIAQLRRMVTSHGYSVQPVPFEGCLHLKSAATLVADDLVLLNPAWVRPGEFHPLRTLAIDPAEPFAANALRVGDVLVFPREHPRTAARLRTEGLEVREVPAGELARAEGGVTCGCLLVREA